MIAESETVVVDLSESDADDMLEMLGDSERWEAAKIIASNSDQPGYDLASALAFMDSEEG